MKFYLDTEFVHGWKGVELISVGIARDDGDTYYAINQQMNLSECSRWVTENVITRLERNPALWKTPEVIKEDIREFLGFGSTEGWVPPHHHTLAGRPEIWGWYPAYDWYLISRMFGPFDEHPKGFPNMMRALDQWIDDVEFEKNYARFRLAKPANAHNALADAIWVRDYHKALLERKAGIEANARIVTNNA